MVSNASSLLGSSVSGKSFTITGEGFGGTAGTVHFVRNGSLKAADVTSWGPTSIVVKAPAVELQIAGSKEDFFVKLTSSNGIATTTEERTFSYYDCDTCRLNDNCPF
jgi:hypothetical protein